MGVTIIGAGLAGCEAAWVLAGFGIPVRLCEMKPRRFSPAHNSQDLAELVCSNSFRSDSPKSAVGILKQELRVLGSLIMEAADQTNVPAGKALAVDRIQFSKYVTQKIESCSKITVERRELLKIPHDPEETFIISTGPLTSDLLAQNIVQTLGGSGLYFYDAIAPIVYTESLQMDKLFLASRYEEGEGDYLNAPMDRNLYERFVFEIRNAEKVEPHVFEKTTHFEGCLPIEELASRGLNTLAFGPMKPVGLLDPETGKRPHAVVQLRAENRERTLYNLVGFQTKMAYREQERVFRMIPGLEKAVFARLGSIHRNTYINAPTLLDEFSRSKTLPNVFFAGQITGVEGYVESTASGLAVGLMCALILKGISPLVPPVETAIGGLLKHTRDLPIKKYEPMNVNFGMIKSDIGKVRKLRKEEIAETAIKAVQNWKTELENLWTKKAS
ncbi:MAG: methylenetetrahydrofolate--tRNA-(uracil(54)-C(5))-methyltransferase (FADH(2)-oxidizing) TrmFO, partial [Desulfomonilaceae bacterium]